MDFGEKSKWSQFDCKIQGLGILCTMFSLVLLSGTLEIALAIVSLRGSILNDAPRNGVPYLLYVRLCASPISSRFTPFFSFLEILSCQKCQCLCNCEKILCVILIECDFQYKKSFYAMQIYFSFSLYSLSMSRHIFHKCVICGGSNELNVIGINFAILILNEDCMPFYEGKYQPRFSQFFYRLTLQLP